MDKDRAYIPTFWGVTMFRNGVSVHCVTLSIGDDLTVYIYNKCIPNCRFIKVTRKGFNIVDLDTNRCLLKKHVYASGMANKEYPSKGPIRGNFMVPTFMSIIVRAKPVENAG